MQNECAASLKRFESNVENGDISANQADSIFTLRRKSALEEKGITHIVSVLKYDFKDFEHWEQYQHLSIEVDDVDDENLLVEFERTGKFIEKGLKSEKDGKKGGVLVHW